jgi:hypothetical protein
VPLAGKIVGLMDLPRLMDNLTVDHRRLDRLRLPTTPQPRQQQRDLFLGGMKGKNREGFRVSGTTLPRLGKSGYRRDVAF